MNVDAAFSQLPAFESFRNVVTENIQLFPEVKLDFHSGHRVQIFDDPGSIPRVFFSKRALARYKCNKDALNYALTDRAPEKLSIAACLLLGRQLLLTNRVVGAAFIAHAFTKVRSEYLPDEKVYEYMVRGVAEDNQSAITNLFLPLAHEIGHLEKSQAIAPRVIHTDAFLETYRINYKTIQPITGDFDFAASQNDRESPLYLPLLREEVVADWFAVNTVFLVNHERSKDGQFQLADVCGSVITFPLVAAFAEMCLTEWRSKHYAQQILLATQCRYSLLIDSMRAAAKRMFPRFHKEIDSLMVELDSFHRQAFSMIWNATVQFFALSDGIMNFSDAEVANYVRDTTPPGQWLHVYDYLVAILDDAAGYPIFESNRSAYRCLFDGMVTFDTVVITDRGVVGIP